MRPHLTQNGQSRPRLTAAVATVALSACAAPNAAIARAQKGGRLQMERNAKGEYVIGLVPGGLRCDEWVWFRKEASTCCATTEL